MAKSDNEREPPVVFRHRIVGAVVLVALAVLIVPVILNATAPVAQERPAPATDTGRDGTKLFVSRITPAGQGTKPEQVHKSVSGPLPPTLAPSPATAAPDPVPVIPSKAESKTAEKNLDESWTPQPVHPSGKAAPAGAPAIAPIANDKKAADTAAAKNSELAAKNRDTAENQKTVKVKTGWIVQAGVFVQRENADRIANKLKAAGHRPTVGPITYRGKSYYRVYVGPYASQDEARRMSARVGQAIHDKVAVVAFP